MHDIPLNETQRIFADKNHNLVYKFLHEKNLPASEYYDIVIFGYLRAVQRYLTDPNLAGYSFSTVAWRAMEGEVVNTHRTDKRRFRVIRFVRPRQSYTGHLTWRSTPTVTDEEALRESEVALLLHKPDHSILYKYEQVNHSNAKPLFRSRKGGFFAFQGARKIFSTFFEKHPQKSLPYSE